MKIKKSVLTLALALAVMFGVIVGANASDGLKAITASLNYGITIKYNGNVQEMKDAGGNRVYPISYEGTTYLPVRAVADMLGIAVNWDGPTQTVWLGDGAPAQQAQQSKSDDPYAGMTPAEIREAHAAQEVGMTGPGNTQWTDEEKAAIAQILNGG